MFESRWMVATVVATIAGCVAESDDAVAPRHLLATAAQTQPVDLVSAATCEVLNGKLRRCRIDARTLFPVAAEMAVPVRTVARRQLSGTCATPYALEVGFSGPELVGTTRYRFLADRDVILRAPGGAQLTQLTMADSSSWTGTASFDASCAIKVVLSINEPDIDTREQAEAALASIDLALVEARTQRDNYQHLMLFSAAHQFLKAVADNLHQEVSNDMMQELRAAYLDALDAFDELDGSSACQEDLGDSLERIRGVADALFILGDPADWVNPDGSPRTLADMYAEFRGDGVVAQIDALLAQSSPTLEAQYRDGYEAAALLVVQLEARRALATAQLAPWLGGGQ